MTAVSDPPANVAGVNSGPSARPSDVPAAWVPSAQRRGTVPEPRILPTVLSASSMSNTFLGDLIEVCFATEDCQRTMDGMVRLGIGPWRVYTFDATTVTGREHGGEPADWALRVAFADVGDMAFEIMQPLYGPTIIREFLDAHGEGVHHIAFDCGGSPWAGRAEEFSRRGFPCSQAGRFMDKNAFAFFDTESATTTTFETYTIPEGFVWPEPEYWFPSPPPPGEAPPVREQSG